MKVPLNVLRLQKRSIRNPCSSCYGTSLLFGGQGIAIGWRPSVLDRCKVPLVRSRLAATEQAEAAFGGIGVDSWCFFQVA